MKTPQKLEIKFEGLVFAQDMHSKMLYTKELEAGMLKIVGNVDKSFNIFMTRKDTKDFIEVLKREDNLQDSDIVYGRGKTKRINPFLAFKYATWVSKEFELLVYKFFMEYYPEIRELGGDRYNDFRNIYLPKIYNGDNAKWIVINMNKNINSILDKEKGWNKQNKFEYKSREYIYMHIIADIERGLKPKSRQKVTDWLNERIAYHFETLKIIFKEEQKNSDFGKTEPV
ncbi:MAG TPA: KilA-N domain-containing protein [Campylobacterales bacterium]|nr:KilA-N domain-containing protein [Campylobacterales bacterium]